MLYKRNLIGFENIIGIFCVIWGYIIIVYENIFLWYERDIFYFFVECIMLLDVIIVLDYVFNWFMNIVDWLIVYEDNMRNNIDKMYGLIFL